MHNFNWEPIAFTPRMREHLKVKIIDNMVSGDFT
jgi:hypothetical protein